MEEVSSEKALSGIEDAVIEPPSVPRQPWRFWPTIGLSLASGGISFLAQIVFTVAWVVCCFVCVDSYDISAMVDDGNYLFGAAVFSHPFLLGIVWLFVRLRPGFSFAEYVGWKDWRKLKVSATLPWFGGLGLIMVSSHVLTTLFGTEPSQMMLNAMRSANITLSMFAIVVAAPIVEEIFFRGFMFKGLEVARGGGVSAVLLSTLSWVLIHGFQYNLVELAYLFVFGLLLGMARLRTGSIALPIALHIVNNLVAGVSSLIMLNNGML